MDVILKEGIDLLNEIGAKQSTSEEILEKMGQGVTAQAVKKVLYGVANVASISGGTAITIEETDPSKYSINVRTASASGGNSSFGDAVHVVAKKKNSFSLLNSGSYTTTASWEVIIYY